ncbi:MAG: enoyl-CoA hydratase-related protein [Pseudomonadota bacterium]
MSDAVLYDQTGRVVTLTLNRPDTRNALSADLVKALVAGLERADGDAGVSCVVIAAAGKGFSSGGNLRELKDLTKTEKRTPAQVAEWYETGIQRIPMAMRAVTVPTVAAVHGAAIGAGCDLTCMADIRIAAEDAVFAESFIRVGLIPGDGGAWFLPRVVGPARAREMLFTAAGVPAQKALDWGLVSRVVPAADLLAEAQALAAEIAALPPQALRESKKLINACEHLSLEDGLAMAREMQGRLQQLDDHHEAIDAILEKRKPSFSGR